MVSTLSIVFMFVSLLVIFLFPISLLIYMHRRERISWKAVLVGALVFIVFQFATRLPLLNYLNTQGWFQALATNLVFTGVVVGGLTAGLFEETGRYLGFRFFLKGELCWKNGIAYGIGHGGIEAIGLIGLTYINNLALSFMINNGMFDTMVAPYLDSGMAAEIKRSLIETAPGMFLLGGLERVFTIVIQIALSLVVLYGVMNRKISYLFLAILLHTAINAPAVLTARGLSFWYIELYLLFLAVIGTIFVIKSRPYFDRISGSLFNKY
jgi:uncharacterized membrane protein YhfC